MDTGNDTKYFRSRAGMVYHVLTEGQTCPRGNNVENKQFESFVRDQMICVHCKRLMQKIRIEKESEKNRVRLKAIRDAQKP